MKPNSIRGETLEGLSEQVDHLIENIAKVTTAVDLEIGRIDKLQVDCHSLSPEQEQELQATKLELYNLDFRIRAAKRPRITGEQK